MKKAEYLRRMVNALETDRAFVVAGVGSGITAKAAVLGGADMLATYSTAVYRIQALSTALAFLPYDDCNTVAFGVAPQVLAVAGNTPVIIGLGAHDPRRKLDIMVENAKSMGIAGITNEPFVGMYGGDLRKQLDAAGLGFDREVELIKIASENELITLAYVFSPIEAIRMADVGADFIGIMVGGITSGGTAGGVPAVGLDEAIGTVNDIIAALGDANLYRPCLVHGGPLNDVDSVQKVLNSSRAAGYITGSTGERLPTEVAVCEKIQCFKSVRRGNPI